MIKALNITYSYPDKTLALDNISFEIEKGETVALLGENGAGKSTLIMMMAGFILPDKGTLEIDSIKLENKSVKEIRRKVGIVFQDSDDQIFMPTVYDDIAFGAINMGLKGDELKERIENAMRDTNIESLKYKEPSRISSGEKRKVAIAGVLAMQNDIIILDEPTTSLDYKSKKQLISLLNSIEATKIIATHNIFFAKETASKALILHNKTVAYFGDIKDVLEDSDFLESCNLEPIYKY